jgi:hypothetical protein
MTIKRLTGFFARNIIWLLLFSFCFLYWAYLIKNTDMVVVCDSIQYEQTGRLIYEKGWLEFFRTGPHREPLYPALIAWSMALGDFFSTGYQFILKIHQVALLFFTQVLLLFFLRRIGVRESVIMPIVLYYGISPAVINAAFSMYYEIVGFPFVLASVWLASSVWIDIEAQRRYSHIFGKAILFGACFILLALGRGVFQYVFYLYMLPFVVWTIAAVVRMQGRALVRIAIFVATAFILFSSAVSSIKAMNKRYNGESVLCKTHLSILLASAYKRSQPLTPRIIAANILLIPGTGVCRKYFSREECDYADWYGADIFREFLVREIMVAIPPEKHQLVAFCQTFEKALEHPVQYFILSVVEALKMPFWESTKIGYVTYPPFLTWLYDQPLMRFGLRLFAALVTMAAFAFVTLAIWRRRIARDKRKMLLFVWLMIVAYTFFYALCYVVTRYSLPIVSLYLACVAFTVNALLPGIEMKEIGKIRGTNTRQFLNKSGKRIRQKKAASGFKQ